MDAGSGSLMELLETILGTALTARLRDVVIITEKSILVEQFMEVLSGDRITEEIKRQFCRTLIDELRGEHDAKVRVPSPEDVGYPSPLEYIVDQIKSHNWMRVPKLLIDCGMYSQPLSPREQEKLEDKGWEYSINSTGTITIKANHPEESV